MSFIMKNLKLTEKNHHISNFVINNASSLDKYKISPEELEKQKEKRDKIKYMYSLYDKYRTTYFNYYKKATLDELSELKEAFPNVKFFTEFRIKSKTSYKKKVVKKINQGYTGKIYDLYGSKIVIESYIDENGNQISDEPSLIAKSMEISEYLQKRKSKQTSEGIREIETVHSKDYITNPKESGYQSYHVLRHLTFSKNDSNSPDISFYSETQVKTKNMYIEEQYGKKFGHSTAYKNNRDFILKNSKNIEDDVPIFLKVFHNNHSKKDDIVPYPFRQCFERFFSSSYDDYIISKGEQETEWSFSGK